ncbi:hypothetical protein [Arcticibacter eurypsychrophilus]|uniref:hypothetical protein n=1 Tax=Arcticibacter eurypsychrophilus TaxID=1434752 RepID=UPI00084D9DD5|nr:hypothetical protein [Arcticibacter eurypsychrophilus]
MKAKRFFKGFALLFLSGVSIFGCKKTSDQNILEPVSTITEKPLSLAESVIDRPMTYRNTFYNTDYLSVGTGGLIEIGSNEIKVPGTFPLRNVTRAYLYWHINSTGWEYRANLNFNGYSIYPSVIPGTILGTTIGIAGPNNGADGRITNELFTLVYRADVTDAVKAASSRIFKFRGFGTEYEDESNPVGASLVIFYSDGDPNNNRDIVLFDGNDSNKGFAGFPGNPNAPFDPEGWDVLLSGLNYTTGKGIMTMHVADGQQWEDGNLFLNSQKIASGSIFSGNTVPGATATSSARWDIKPIDITPWLRPDVKSLHVTLDKYVDDLLSLVIVVFNLPKGAAPVSAIQVPFDYRPLNCPNTLRTSSSAEEAAIMGSSTFDVSKVDLSTVKLNGIPFKKSRVIDKSAPFKGDVTSCSTCSNLAPDGIKDLEFLFDSQLLLKTMGTVQDKQCVKVTLTGKLLPQYGSTPIKGEDYIVISK